MDVHEPQDSPSESVGFGVDDSVEDWLTRPLGRDDLQKAVRYAETMEPDLRKEFMYHYVSLFSDGFLPSHFETGGPCEWGVAKENQSSKTKRTPPPTTPATKRTKKSGVMTTAPVVLDFPQDFPDVSNRDSETATLQTEWEMSPFVIRTPIREEPDAEELAKAELAHYQTALEKLDEEDDELLNEAAEEGDEMLSISQVRELPTASGSASVNEFKEVGLLENLHSILREKPEVEEYLSLQLNIFRVFDVPLDLLAKKMIDFLTDITESCEKLHDASISEANDSCPSLVASESTSLPPLVSASPSSLPPLVSASTSPPPLVEIRECGHSPASPVDSVPSLIPSEEAHRRMVALTPEPERDEPLPIGFHLRELQSGLQIIQTAYDSMLTDLTGRKKFQRVQGLAHTAYDEKNLRVDPEGADDFVSAFQVSRTDRVEPEDSDDCVSAFEEIPPENRPDQSMVEYIKALSQQENIQENQDESPDVITVDDLPGNDYVSATQTQTLTRQSSSKTCTAVDTEQSSTADSDGGFLDELRRINQWLGKERRAEERPLHPEDVSPTEAHDPLAYANWSSRTGVPVAGFENVPPYNEDSS